jgi:hypothetical protein
VVLAREGGAVSLPAEFFAPFVAMCTRLQCDPVDLLAVAANESGLKAEAWNRSGDASGLWQLMPSTARGLGWDVFSDPHLAGFRALGPVGQLVWWERYFGSYRGRLVNRSACYTATFLPAFLSHAGDPAYVLCGARGPLAWAYAANKGFDPTGKGTITVADLTAAIDHACALLGSTWNAAVAGIRAAQSPQDNVPRLDVAVNDPPVYMAPEQPDRDPEDPNA